MDTCATLGEPQGCNQFASPDDESTVQAVFNKNLAFALNVTNSLPNLGRPKNFDNDPSHYQVKPTQDIQPNRLDVSYGARQTIEATVRKELGTVKARVVLTTPNGGPTKANTQTIVPLTTAPAGERYGEVPGGGRVVADLGLRQDDTNLHAILLSVVVDVLDGRARRPRASGWRPRGARHSRRGPRAGGPASTGSRLRTARSCRPAAAVGPAAPAR